MSLGEMHHVVIAVENPHRDRTTSYQFRPFQENKPPKYKLSSEEKASGLKGFKFWNYLRACSQSEVLRDLSS
jgi:hypothetical protein